MGPYSDKGGARPPGDGCEPQFTVAGHVEPGQFDFDPFGDVHGQVAAQRGGGDVPGPRSTPACVLMSSSAAWARAAAVDMR